MTGGEGSHGDATYEEETCPLVICPHSSRPNAICTQYSTSLLTLNRIFSYFKNCIYSVYKACLLYTLHKWWQILLLVQL